MGVILIETADSSLWGNTLSLNRGPRNYLVSSKGRTHLGVIRRRVGSMQELVHLLRARRAITRLDKLARSHAVLELRFNLRNRSVTLERFSASLRDQPITATGCGCVR